MARHLTEVQAATRLALGKSIAQFLSHQDKPEYTVLRYIILDTGDDKAYGVCYHEVEDEGDEDFLDIGEFTSLDAEEPYGVLTEFDSVEEVLAFSAKSYGALPHRYVAESMIDEEYADYLKERPKR